MTKWNLKPGKKTTGGLKKRHGKKTRYQRGRDYLPARVGKGKIKVLRTRGGNMKLIAFAADTASVTENGKSKTTKIISVLENSADSQFVRRNIITKGAIIETELGKARVTSRPGQNGTVSAILIEKK